MLTRIPFSLELITEPMLCASWSFSVWKKKLFLDLYITGTVICNSIEMCSPLHIWVVFSYVYTAEILIETLLRARQCSFLSGASSYELKLSWSPLGLNSNYYIPRVHWVSFEFLLPVLQPGNSLKAISWDKHRTCFICFLSVKNHCPSFADIQHLKTTLFEIFCPDLSCS